MKKMISLCIIGMAVGIMVFTLTGNKIIDFVMDKYVETVIDESRIKDDISANSDKIRLGNQISMMNEDELKSVRMKYIDIMNTLEEEGIQTSEDEVHIAILDMIINH